LRKLLPFAKKYWYFCVLAPILMLIDVYCEQQMPMLMSNIMDTGIKMGDKPYIIRIGLMMIGLALVAIICGCANQYTSSMASQGFGSQLRAAMFRRIQTFSFFNIDKFSTASLVTRMTNDCNRMQNTFMMILRMMIRAPLMFIVALVRALTINARLAIILVIAMPIIFIATTQIMRVASERFRIMQRKLDGLNSAVQENLIAIRVVKAFAREEFEKEKFYKANDDMTQAGIRAVSVIIWNMPIMMLVMNFSTIAVYWFGGQLVSAGSMGTGELIAFISYMMQILFSMQMVSMILMQISQAKASMNRVIEVLETQPDIDAPEAVKALPESERPQVENGDIEFRNVSFRYATSTTGDNVLENISFSAKSGQVIALIGATGSAKSTLVSLIPRFYDVTEGEVLVGDHNVKDYDPEDLRRAIGMVLQKNVLFTGTIRDNILWGKPDATDEEIEEACASAQELEFIQSFPEGFDTILGQGGVNVSGGQKQRICIARAMIKKPKILILDDSTSAVDSATEEKIREAFRNELKDTTVIIIAQRLSSIQYADEIVILDDGKIADIGNHESLLANSSIYQEIYQSQLQSNVRGEEQLI